MKLKRLKQLGIAGAAGAALAMGAPAIAAADGDSSGSFSKVAVQQSGSGETNLTDHELYVRHHQRLASPA
jgi:hypothetical protein